jgi:capsular polysaccharide biosynthesis protein
MEPDIKEYFGVITKRLWFIVVMISIVCGATAIYDFLYAKPIYEAGTKLIVSSSNRVEGINRTDFNEISSNILLIDTYKEIITSPTIIEKVINENPELNLDEKQLASQLKISSSSKSQVINITIQSSTQQRAVSIVNAVSEIFKREIPIIMNVDNVSILSKAKMTDEPRSVAPSLLYKLMIAFIIAIMVSIAIVLLWEYLDDTIKSEKDVMLYLGKPTLSTINKIKKSDLYNGDKVRKKRAGDSVSISINPKG